MSNPGYCPKCGEWADSRRQLHMWNVIIPYCTPCRDARLTDCYLYLCFLGAKTRTQGAS